MGTPDTTEVRRQEMDSTQRFALDEARAAEYLAGQVAQYERWPRSDGEPTEVEIGESYSPQNDEGGIDTTNLVMAARDAGLITGPGHVDYDHLAEADGNVGYTWLVYPDGPGNLQLSTFYTKIKFLGSGEARGGAEEALGVLREAVFEANALLDGLDRYIAARQREEG